MPKFDESDRDKVIAEVEKHFGAKVSRVPGYRKFLEDGSGKSYWVLGGYEDWHGITSEMLEEERRRSTEGVLIVAKRRKSTIDMFYGPLQTLIANHSKLSHKKDGDYQFNVAICGNFMTIREILGFTLKKLGSPQEVGAAVSPQLRDAQAAFAKMSPEERERLLEEISGKAP